MLQTNVVGIETYGLAYRKYSTQSTLFTELSQIFTVVTMAGGRET